MVARNVGTELGVWTLQYLLLKLGLGPIGYIVDAASLPGEWDPGLAGMIVEAEGTEHSFLDSVQRREYERKRAKLLANPREINEKTDLLLPFQEKSVTGAPMEALRYTLKEPVVVMELKYSDGRSVMMSKESFAILRDLESDRSVFGDLVENKAIFLEAKPRTLHPGMRVVMGAVQVRGSLAELWPSTQHTPIMQYLQERD